MKKAVSIALLVALIGTLAGCSGAADPNTSTAGETANISFWFFGDDLAKQFFNERLETIKDQVTVEQVEIPGDEYENKLRIACNTGTAPDTFMVDGVYTAYEKDETSAGWGFLDDWG